jgi:hypothetical protein
MRKRARRERRRVGSVMSSISRRGDDLLWVHERRRTGCLIVTGVFS